MQISVILPAKNEAEGLSRVLPALRAQMPDAEIIVADDGSTDGTAGIAASHGARVLSAPYSMGNGAAIKRGARAASGDVLVFMDADGQHDPALIPRLLERLEDGYDMVVGARDSSGQASAGRGLANALYNRLASWMTGHRVADLTSGFRVARADRFRQFLHLLPNGFSYPTTSTMAFFRSAYAVAYVPVPVAARIGKSHIRPLRDGVRFLLIIFRIATLYSPLKLFAPVGGGFFLLGLGYYAWTFATQHRFTNMSALLFSASVIIFLIGLISEQITSLTYQAVRSERRSDDRPPAEKAPLLVLIGTKAQFIKTAPILKSLDERGLGYHLVYTGQHSETFSELEQAFGTRPADDNLVPSFEAADHASFLRWCARFWRAAFHRLHKGDWRGMRIALVHGDTASTLFSALAARLTGVRVAHVEAGLRSRRLLEPFPEEIIRRLVSRLSAVHFAPDSHAASNLASVGGRVVLTGGNTLRDALSMALRAQTLPEYGGEGGYGIASIHRSENLSSAGTFGMLMASVIRAAAIAPVWFVLHPVTRRKILSGPWATRLAEAPGLRLVDRTDYPTFVRMLIGSSFLMTDGGSNQEEAAMLGLPTLLLRRETERPDGLGGNVELSGLDPCRIDAFVRAHAGRRWVARGVDGPSPSDAIAAHLATMVAR